MSLLPSQTLLLLLVLLQLLHMVNASAGLSGSPPCLDVVIPGRTQIPLSPSSLQSMQPLSTLSNSPFSKPTFDQQRLVH